MSRLGPGDKHLRCLVRAGVGSQLVGMRIKRHGDDAFHKVREALLSGELADLAASQRRAAPHQLARMTAIAGGQ